MRWNTESTSVVTAVDMPTSSTCATTAIPPRIPAGRPSTTFLDATPPATIAKIPVLLLLACRSEVPVFEIAVR